MYYILGGWLDGFGPACMSCCWEFEGYRSTAWFGKKAGEIKRNDVAHLLYLYSISSPQTAGPGCRDERLSGGQERRSRVRTKMASSLSNAWKCNPTLPSVLGCGRTYESSVSLDSRLGVRSSRSTVSAELAVSKQIGLLARFCCCSLIGVILPVIFCV